MAVILGVLTVTFLVTRVFAPDPTSLFLGAAGNGFASAAAQAAARAKVRADLGLDTRCPTSTCSFLSQIVHGDLGMSFQTGRPVTSDLLSRLPGDGGARGVLAALRAWLSGLLAGSSAAVRHERLFDRVARFFTIGFLAMPQFWIGLMLLWIFYTQLHVVPGPDRPAAARDRAATDITGFYVIDASAHR